jgi:hypothetical protein
MFGRKTKKPSQPSQGASTPPGRQDWEHYTVTVAGAGTVSSAAATEAINTMTGAGWEFVSQSAAGSAFRQRINLVFRRPHVRGAPDPPVTSTSAPRPGCALVGAMLQLAVAALVALLRRLLGALVATLRRRRRGGV